MITDVVAASWQAERLGFWNLSAGMGSGVNRRHLANRYVKIELHLTGITFSQFVQQNR
jgi:hypothetical protein